jgi:hypothetical protein
MLIYEKQQEFDNRELSPDDPFWTTWRSYLKALVDAGVYVGGSPLERADTTATTVRVRGGERQVQDGPYADTKEQLGGFMLLELPDLDAALQWAARCPAAAYAAVEIRPAANLERFFGPEPGSLFRG